MQLFVKLSPTCKEEGGSGHECLDRVSLVSFSRSINIVKLPSRELAVLNSYKLQLSHPRVTVRPQSQLCSRIRSHEGLVGRDGMAAPPATVVRGAVARGRNVGEI